MTAAGSEPLKIQRTQLLADAGDEAVRETILAQLELNPEHYIAEYTHRFGNILNADDATGLLFSQYNDNPARYRVAVHPAAQWIRDISSSSSPFSAHA